MKKINKILCTGALALTSAFTLTGCNLFNKDLSDEQMDKLMHVVENADKFMDDTLSILDAQNTTLDKKEAYELYRDALTKFDLNVDGIRDNVSVKTNNDSNGEYYQDYYKKSNGDYVYINGFFREGVKDMNTIVYESTVGNETKVYSYESDLSNKYSSTDAYLFFEGYLLTDDSNAISYEYDTLTSSELLENGNYKLTFRIEDHDLDRENENADLMISSVVVSADAKIISAEAQYVYAFEYALGNEEEYYYETAKATVEFYYGTLESSYIEQEIGKAEAHRNQ